MTERYIKRDEELFAIEPGWFNRDNPRTSLMCYGFCVGPGWTHLVRFLLENAKARQKRWDEDYKEFVDRRDGGLFGHLRREWEWYWTDPWERFIRSPVKVTTPPTIREAVRGVWRSVPRHYRHLREGRKKFVEWEKCVELGRPGNPFAPGNFAIEQVKEKFGGLRFYFRGGDAEYRTLVRFTEDFSYCICEQCGAPGKLDNPNRVTWIKTLCDTHRKR